MNGNGNENDDRDRRDETKDAKEHFRQGIGLLFRAAREAATGIKKEIDRSNLAKSLDDAGRELARAATNVVGRIEKEIKKVQPSEPSYMKEQDPQDPQPWKSGGDDRRDGGGYAPPGKKPTGPTPDDPGFRIAGDPSRGDKPQ